MITLGAPVQHIFHDIKGVVTAQAQYLTGCHQSRVERIIENKIVTTWFDDVELEVIAGEGMKASVVKGAVQPGGPQNSPTRSNHE